MIFIIMFYLLSKICSKNINCFIKNLKQVSLDTVQGFLKDSIKANYKIDIKK